MKFAVVLALFGAALALRGQQVYQNSEYSQKNIQETSFRAGREYRYQFNGQVSAGLPLPGAQTGATRLQSLIALHFHSDNKVTLQLNEIRFGLSQDNRDARQLQPFAAFEEVRMDKEQQETLALPVQFYYQNGMISELRFAQEDQAWSENIKRAVLNMLQVNLLKKGQDNEKIAREQTYEQDNLSFTTYERTLEGECEVFYTQEQSERNQEWQQWTKSIKLDKCQQRPQIRHTFVPVCEECQQTLNQDNLSSSVLSFNVSGTPEHYLLHWAELRSQHMFAPINEKQQLLGAFVHNTLELVYAGEKETQMKQVRGERVQELIYNSEWEIAEEKFAQTGEEKYLRQIPEWNNKVEQVEKLISLMGKQIEEGLHYETAHVVSRIVKVLRVCNEEELNKIHRHVAQNQQFNEKVVEQIRSIYYNCLALAGTRTTIQHLGQKIEQQQVTPFKAAQLMKTLVDMRFPSKQNAEEIQKICDMDVVAQSPVLRQSCQLTYGAVLNAVCGFPVQPLHRQLAQKDDFEMCPREYKKKVVKQLVEQYKSAGSRYEKTLALKTLANAGIDLSIYELEKIILDQQEDKAVRVQAIEALRKLGQQMPRKVQQILMPIYKSRQQPVQIRMSALYQIFRTQPESSTLFQLVNELMRERSQQVRSLTVSMIRSFANNESPCQQKFAAQCARILADIPVHMTEQIEKLESRFGSWAAYNQQYQSGVEAQFGAMFTNESILPNDIMAQIDGVFAGEWNQYMAQLGLSQQNIDQVIRKLVTKVQEAGLEQIVVRGKRSTGSFRPTEILNSLLEKLRITRRQQNQDEPHALLYVRVRDMDYAFVPFDVESIPEMIKSMIQNGQIEIADLERVLAQGTHFNAATAAFFYESVRRIPTALGMPVQLSTKMPTVATVQGHIKVELEPKNGKKMNGVRVQLKAQPKIVSNHVTSLAILCPVAQTGAKLIHQAQFNTPIDTQLQITWEDKLVIKTITKAPREEFTLAQLLSRPVTYTRVWNKNARQYPEPTLMTVFLPKQYQPVQQIVDREYFAQTGLKINVNGQISRPLFPTPAHTPKPILVADNDLQITVVPTEQAPEQIETRFELELFQSAELEQPQLQKYFDNSRKQYIQTDDEYMDEDERNTYIQRYAKNYKIEQAYKHKLVTEVKTVGEKELYARTQFTATCDKKMRYCKTVVEARRSPVQEERKPWELKATVQTLYPETPKTFEQMMEQKNRHFVALCECNWGSDEQNEMTIKIRGQQSQEQRLWIEKISRQDKTEEKYQLTEQWKLQEAARLNQYQLNIQYKLAEQTQQYFEKLFDLVQTYQYYGFQQWFNTRFETQQNQENRIRAHLTIEPIRRQLCNLTIESPEQRVNFEQIELPFALPTAQIHYQHQPKHQPKRHFVEKVAQRVSQNAECVVKSKEIQTFDKVFYRAPITPCYSVLAKDCASKTPEFVVLMKQTKKGSEEKTVKIVYGNNEIKLEMIKGKIVANVNGNEQEYDEKNYELEQENTNEYTLNWYNEKMVKVETDAVTVQFDGYQARVHISALYKNQQCGLCGHYDNDEDSEFRGADNEEKEDIQEFAKSYLYKDDECKIDNELVNNKKHYRRVQKQERKYDRMIMETSEEKEEQYNKENQYDEQEPEQQTVVIERQHEICFSQEQQPQCPENMQPTENKKQKIVFSCVSASNSQARRMLRDARRQPLTQRQFETLQELPKYQERTLVTPVPKSCERSQDY